MKTGLFYFTGTGNSLFVARAIENEIGNTDMISIPQALLDREFLYEFDEVGFVFPTYYGGLPVMVERFIEKIELPRVRYIFAVTTKGSSMSYNTIKNLDRILDDLGYLLNYGKALQLPNNYIRKKNWRKSNKSRKSILSRDVELKKIVMDIKTLEDNSTKKSTLQGRIAEVFYKGWQRGLRHTDRSFTSAGVCMDCHICEVVCPSNNIRVEDEVPKWHGKCQDCMACIQVCPSKNIQIGEYTKGKERYINPFVDIKDIMDSNR